MARVPAAAAAIVVAAVVGAFFLSVPLAMAQSGPYTNYTVGDSAGWVFNSVNNKPAADYSSWAAKQSFSLGDYLIFRTNANSTVIQSYNETTYGLCSLDEDNGNLTTQWTPPEGANGGPGNGAEVIAVPLTQQGNNYYFSSAGDGIQCEKGMKFHIVVSHGSGLPPELNQPPPPPPAPAAPPPSTPIEATTTSQSQTYYNGDGGRRGERRLALAFSLCFLPLLLPPAILFA